MDNARIILRCQQGDLEAFQQLVEACGKKARQTAYLISRRKDLAEDIAQEAFIQCYREIKSLKQPEKFQSWFYKILVRVCIRMMRKEKWRSLFSPYVEIEPVIQSYVAQEVENRELYNKLYEAVGKLTKPLRTVVILYYFNELSVIEIAAILDCKEGTIKSRLHAARNQLADSLQEYGFSPNRIVNGGESTCWKNY